MNPTDCSLIGAGLGIVGVLIGIIIGNRLAISRDRRCEFNALVEPVHDLVYRWDTPDELTILKIRERLNCWQRTGFDRAIEAYKKSQSEENRNSYSTEASEIYEGGGGRFKNPDLIKSAANDLLYYFKRR